MLSSLTLTVEVSLKVALFLLCFGELWIRCLEREYKSYGRLSFSVTVRDFWECLHDFKNLSPPNVWHFMIIKKHTIFCLMEDTPMIVHEGIYKNTELSN